MDGLTSKDITVQKHGKWMDGWMKKMEKEGFRKEH
jgi:allantoicase